jgi:hypothetical protein
MTRQCGECTLCCKLLPVDEGFRHPGIAVLIKKAGERCPHQRFGKGCAIYATRPLACRFWNCRWLVNADTTDLSRPDRSHCVIDIMPDVIRLTYPDLPQRDIEVVQIWIDPAYPDAWRTPEMMAFIERRAKEGRATLVRYNQTDAIAVFAPSLSDDGKWHEEGSNNNNQELLAERKRRYGY